MPKKSRQKLKYLENENNFQDETKSIFHEFRRAIIEANRNSFLECESLTIIFLRQLMRWLPLSSDPTNNLLDVEQ